MFKTIFATITVAIALPAAPIVVIEPPDHPGTGGTTYILDIGANSFSGSVAGCPNCGGDYRDNFTIVLPVGLSVDLGSLSATVNTGGGSNAQLACFTSFGCFGSGFFAGASDSVFNNPTRSFDFTATSPYSIPSVEIPGSSSYTLTYNVVADTRGGAVPEPSTWLLLGAGLAAIAYRRRSF